MVRRKPKAGVFHKQTPLVSCGDCGVEVPLHQTFHWPEPKLLCPGCEGKDSKRKKRVKRDSTRYAHDRRTRGA
jgi:hypothetical protein